MTLNVDDVIHAWTSQVDKKLQEDPKAVQKTIHLTDHMLKLLVEGRPVTAEQLAVQANRPLEEVEKALQKFREQGGEFDEAGHLVGAALTITPTPHRFRVNGHELYAWCALDTIFLPGLLGQTAEVTSTCPVTGETIHLTIMPEGVTQYSPAKTVLSITVPGVSCKTENAPGPETGPQSDTCSQMFFFSSPEAAKEWLTHHPGVVIFTVEDAYKLAYINWIARRKDLALQTDIVGDQHERSEP